MPEPLGTFTSYQEFVALLRQRKDDLGLSNATVDALAGLTDGHTDKVLGPAATKNLGPLTFTALLDALGLSGTLYADPAKAARLSRRWDKRRANRVRENGSGRIAKAAIARVRPVVLAELAAKGGAARWAGSTAGERAAAVEKMNSARLAKRRASTTV
jgi:hypothetical protein